MKCKQHLLDADSFDAAGATRTSFEDVESEKAALRLLLYKDRLTQAGSLPPALLIWALMSLLTWSSVSIMHAGCAAYLRTSAPFLHTGDTGRHPPD